MQRIVFHNSGVNDINILRMTLWIYAGMHAYYNRKANCKAIYKIFYTSFLPEGMHFLLWNQLAPLDLDLSVCSSQKL